MAWSGALSVYVARGTQTATFTPATGLLLFAGAAVLGLPGWLAYAGKWRRWTSGARGHTFPHFPFGLAWMGTGGVLLGVVSLFSALGNIAADIASVLLGIPGIAMFCCGLVFFVRTPRRFLPPWYRKFRPAAKASR